MALVACPRCNITPPQASACGIRCLLRAPRSAASRPPPWRLRRSRAMAVYEGWHSAAAGADTDGGAPAPHVPPSLLVFSGGTAFNGVVEELKKVTTRVAHVLPVSDDGGSTAEIVRVLGGPAVGDIRSRCLRLSDESTAEALSVRKLLGHRLPIDPSEAKLEWYQIVEGDHTLWEGVSRPYRETIRAFLVYFHSEILRRSAEMFCFTNGR
ncbi:maternal effect embryo arrest 18 [Zea mays]|uniref:Maternal effect embryo arrest 18 n=2 Tax=Zea mays TaxID=4577 RepID=A0A1D6NM11_MAIZE|nr:maternal effect embryo arrest 18 [Zea mays]ONM41246.1 maternal effect embryo arrest 18 [Zea mays]